jgi:hypothetical protein
MIYALKAPMDLPVPPLLKKTGGTLDNKRQARIGNDTLRISWYLTTTLVSTTNNLARG